MTKVTITADTVLSIIRKVFADNDIDVITDPSLPKVWMNKSIQEVLNIKYYTFKHRPESSEMIIAEKKKEGVPVTELEALNRAFGCLTLSTVERIFSTNNDIATCDATLDFWVQTGKIKLLEYLIEKTNIALSGVILPVDFTLEDSTIESRSASIVFGRLDSPEFDPESQIGESVRCSIAVQMTIQPPTVMMSNYRFEFASVYPQPEQTWDSVMNFIPVTSYDIDESTNGKPVPITGKPYRVGVRNTGMTKTMAFVFDCIKDVGFIDFLKRRQLLLNAFYTPKPIEGEIDINMPIYVRVTCDDIVAIHKMVITHQHISGKDDGTNEVCSLTLAEGIE